MSTKGSRFSDAEICRQNGWGVGTQLEGVESNGRGLSIANVIQITAIGEEAVLAKCLSHNGEPCCYSREISWTLTLRDWKEVGGGTGSEV